MNHQQIFDTLAPLMSDERNAHFDRVVKDRTRHITVVLEDLYQPHNHSAILRSCDCFGIQDVHLIENRNASELKESIARGAFKWVTTHRYAQEHNNTAHCLRTLKTKGYKVVAASPEPSATTPSTIDLDQPLAIVMGTEWKGISDTVRNEADAFLQIPMFGFTESFNVSVATALILNRLVERMHEEVPHWKLTAEEQIATKALWAKSSVKDSERILQMLHP